MGTMNAKEMAEGLRCLVAWGHEIDAETALAAANLLDPPAVAPIAASGRGGCTEHGCTFPRCECDWS